MKINKVTQWESTIENKDYRFEYQRNNRILTVNEEIIEIKRASTSIYLGTDVAFNFDGKEARFVRHGKKLDVFYEGVGLQSGQEYVAMPQWALLFIGLCLLRLILTSGSLGISMVLIGLIGIFIYQLIAKKRPSLMIYDVLISIPIILSGVIIITMALIYGFSILIIFGVPALLMPTILGLIGADLCWKISRNRMTTLYKILFCMIVVVMAWTLDYIVLYVLLALFHILLVS